MCPRALVLAVALAWTAAAQPADVVVSAAASLSGVLEQIGSLYQQRTGERLSVNPGASNTLARQIVAGARVDLFISADEAQMDTVERMVVPGSRVDLLSNQLAIAVPDDRARTMASARDLLDPSIRRIAIGDPAAVPAGVYAKAWLERARVWKQVEPKLVPCGSVRLALAAVESGAVDAAIIYRTDILSARRTRQAFLVPAAEAPRIVYPAAVIRGGANTTGAERLLAFLRGAEAAAIFERAGFVALTAPRTAR